MRTEIISVVNQKGGTGKTTTTINLGSALAKLGKKVLLLDLDPQGNLSYSLGLADVKRSMANVFEGKLSINDIIVKKDDLYIAPGTNELVDIEISLVNQDDREGFLKERLVELEGNYDYVIIDAPPSLSLLTLNALSAAHEVLIPLQLEVLTMQGLSQILATVQQVKKTLNPSLRVKGIAFVMYDKRRKLSHEVYEYIRENVEENIFKTFIRANVKIAEAPSFGKSVIDYDPSSSGASDYMALAKEILRPKKSSTPEYIKRS
jgi:chromosome partitioning protein